MSPDIHLDKGVDGAFALVLPQRDSKVCEKPQVGSSSLRIANGPLNMGRRMFIALVT